MQSHSLIPFCHHRASNCHQTRPIIILQSLILMGEAESRVHRMQSVPCLHQQQTEAVLQELDKAREPLFRRDPNIIEHEFNCQDKKEPLKARAKLTGDLRLKKTRDLMKTIRENDQENEDIEDVQMRARNNERSGKKSAQKELIQESKTVPVMPMLNLGQVETRGRKFKVTRML